MVTTTPVAMRVETQPAASGRERSVAGGPPRFFALRVTPAGTVLAGTCGRGLSRSEDGGGTWTPVEGLGNGIVHDFAALADGSLLATTGGSGVWRSIDDGVSWQPAGLADQVVYGLAAGAELLAGTEGGGVARSTDGGATWSAAPGSDGTTVYRVLPLASGEVLAGTLGHGVWLRPAADERWQPAGLDGLSVYALVDLGDGLVLAGTRGGGLHLSADAGSTWRPAPAGPPDPVIHTLVRDATGAVLAGTGRGPSRSANRGETWEPMGDTLANRRIFSIAAGNGSVFAGSYDGVWWWSGAAGRWEPVDTGLSAAETFTVAVSPDGRQSLAGTQTEAMVSHDAGQSWQPVDGLGGAAVHSFCWTSRGEVLVGTADGLWAQAEGDGRWRRAGLAGRWVFSLLELDDGRVLAGTLGHGVFVRDGSDRAEWSASNDGLPNPMVYDLLLCQSGEVLAATGVLQEGFKSGGVYRSTDGGRTWSATDHEPITVYRVVEASDGRLFAGAQRCHVLRSADGGVSWETTQPDLDDLKMYCLAVDSDDRLYLAAGALLLRSDDGADSWQEVGEGLDGVTVYDLAEHPSGGLLAATSAGMYRSTDAGSTWQPAPNT